MQIGMIGAGNVGRALGTACVRASHTVRMSAADPAKAQRVAAETGASPAAANREAIAGAEIVVLAVPFDAIRTIVDELGSDLDGRTIVEVSNHMAPDQLGDASNAERVQQMVPGARVVKAFNTVFAAKQSDPRTEGHVLDAYVAADDEEARAAVLELAGTLGFRPVDCGPLAMARALEGMGTLNIWLNMNHGWPWQTGWKLLGPAG